MRILLIEDKIDFAQVIEKAIRAIDGCELSWKRSKAGALAALGDEHFDVVILDRSIPTDDDVLDDHPDHGWALFQAISEQQPGTSVWFLTGTVDTDFPTEVLNAHGKRGDIHSCGREDPLYQVFWKDKMTACIAAVRAFRGEVRQTEGIHLAQVGVQANLRAEEVRLLKLFGRRHGGARVEVRVLQGGLSGARVFRVSVLNAAGAVTIMSVARIGNFQDVAAERDKYRTEIVKLANGAFPPVTAEFSHGAAGFAGIFYQVVGTEVRSLFDELTANPAAAAGAVDRLRTDQATWHGARQVERVRVAAVRRTMIGDVALQTAIPHLDDIDLAAVENVEVDVARCVQHCDLHCGNVLFDNSGRPMVIDYPDTGGAIASLDPIALELSTIFHKDAPDRAGWPSEARADQWTDLDAYCAGSAYEPFIRSCRAWAAGVAASQGEVLAVAYSYVVRQLKYDDTDKVLARAIIRACIAGLVGIGS
ncbi:response regulator [Aminobacter anthyllidis]|uniref:response regulator n=1 Tax=Aminobacter anthyllidis TaxID=1035067 RepID=UPI002453EE2B|nr:response regulator [Aminobacter anthyllidis]MDH4983969.1 response regulator [Aminobacter anthyllidis]